MPYASTVSGTSASSAITWRNPTSFQIVCSGQDLLYAPLNWTSSATYPYLLVVDNNSNSSVMAGTVTGVTPGAMQPEQEDNLTNFGTATIYDMIQAAGS
jgi:hypothetical protein